MFENIVIGLIVIASGWFYVDGAENLVNREVYVQEKTGCVVNSERSYANVQIDGEIKKFSKGKLSFTGKACIPKPE